jgi:hypothetical protein
MDFGFNLTYPCAMSKFSLRVALLLAPLITCGVSIGFASASDVPAGFVSITCHKSKGCFIEGKIGEGLRVTSIDLETNRICSGKTGRSYSVPPSETDNYDDPPRFFTPIKMDPACQKPGLTRVGDETFQAIPHQPETSDALDNAVRADQSAFGFKKKDRLFQPSKPLTRDPLAPLFSYSLPDLRLTVGRYSWGGFCPRSTVLLNGSPLLLGPGFFDEEGNAPVYTGFLGVIKAGEDVVMGMEYLTCESDDPGIVVLYRIDPSGATQITQIHRR